jgi:hypothetical protein
MRKPPMVSHAVTSAWSQVCGSRTTSMKESNTTDGGGSTSSETS